MPRMIDQIRASKLPSNMMQFAAKGALSVPPDENIEILVYLAKHNKVFGDLAKMTLAGWDEKASLAAAANPQTPREVLDYLISPNKLRPKLLPGLLENPSIPAREFAKVAQSAPPDTITLILSSKRTRSSKEILESLRSNPYLKGNEAVVVAELLGGGKSSEPAAEVAPSMEKIPTEPKAMAAVAGTEAILPLAAPDQKESAIEAAFSDPSGEPDEAVAAYLAEHADEIRADEGKPFQAIGGIMELLGADYFPVVEVKDIATESEPVKTGTSAGSAAAAGKAVAAKPAAPGAAAAPKRENTLQKINRLDVKGRIQLALKGNKEERSILIRDGTKVVALAVLEAPKLADGEVEKFASQKNVLEAVLRQIPLKRRFMKNYIVVRNLVANPRTPLDLSLGLMKYLLAADLKNLSANKDVPETVRSLAQKLFKQKQDAANKK